MRRWRIRKALDFTFGFEARHRLVERMLLGGDDFLGDGRLYGAQLIEKRPARQVVDRLPRLRRRLLERGDLARQ